MQTAVVRSVATVNLNLRDHTICTKMFHLLLVTFACLVSVAHADVHVLNDNTFERITQVSSGGTTAAGWFVKVCPLYFFNNNLHQVPFILF